MTFIFDKSTTPPLTYINVSKDALNHFFSMHKTVSEVLKKVLNAIQHFGQHANREKGGLEPRSRAMLLSSIVALRIAKT